VNGGLEFVFQSVDSNTKPRVTQAYVEVTYRTVTSSTVYAGGAYEKKSDGSATKYYAAGGAKVVRQVPPGGGAGTLSWLLADHLGTAVGALDGAGAVVAQQRYWPYGATRSGGVTQTDKLYTGQQEEPGDALGLYNYRARFYSTTIGRFVSGDPVVADAYDPQAWNAYTYVRNNPLRYVDPEGEFFDEPGDSTPLAQQGQFCDRNCRGLKALAAVGLTSAAQVQAHIELVATLQYLTELQRQAGGGAGSDAAVMTAALGIGLTTSAADGPLPFGEAVALSLVGAAACYVYCPDAAQAVADGAGSLWDWASGGDESESGDDDDVETWIGEHVEGYLEERGWTAEEAIEAIEHPMGTWVTRDERRLPGGGMLNEPATGYDSAGGGYVVKNDRTGEIIQVSDRRDPNWRPPRQRQ